MSDSATEKKKKHNDTKANAENLGNVSRVELGNRTAGLLERLEVDSNLLAQSVRALSGYCTTPIAMWTVAVEDVDLIHALLPCNTSSQFSG